MMRSESMMWLLSHLAQGTWLDGWRTFNHVADGKGTCAWDLGSVKGVSFRAGLSSGDDRAHGWGLTRLESCFTGRLGSVGMASEVGKLCAGVEMDVVAVDIIYSTTWPA